MKILITGAAGFIGFYLTKELLEYDYSVIGLDNINNYYSIDLKFNRLNKLGIDRKKAEVFDVKIKSEIYNNFEFFRSDIENKNQLDKIFKSNKFDIVCNLSAQAGVRYSIINPYAYINSNITGFLNVVECCRENKIDKLIYASSSSVYGNNNKIPFNEDDKVDKPESLYAATKKTNELIAHTYSSLYKIKTVGLRFFTVYGPWGRPDMAYFSFTKSILNDEEIKIFNDGNLERDFTYIDDIINGVVKIINTKLERQNLYEIYNIGNGSPVNLLNFVKILEKELNKKAIKKFVEMQPGDVNITYSDTKKLRNDFEFKTSISFKVGIRKFIKWYKEYYEKK